MFFIRHVNLLHIEPKVEVLLSIGRTRQDLARVQLHQVLHPLHLLVNRSLDVLQVLRQLLVVAPRISRQRQFLALQQLLHLQLLLVHSTDEEQIVSLLCLNLFLFALDVDKGLAS